MMMVKGLLVGFILVVALNVNAQSKYGYTVDKTITNCSKFPIMLIGNDDKVFGYLYKIDSTFSCFQISVPKKYKKNKGIAYAYEQLCEENRKLSTNASNVRIYDTLLNYYKARIYEYEVDRLGKQIFHYDAELIYRKTIISFHSEDHDNGKYIDKFKATVQSLRFE